MSGYPLCESGCKIKRLLIKPSTFYHKKRGEKSEKCLESIIEDSSIAQKTKNHPKLYRFRVVEFQKKLRYYE